VRHGTTPAVEPHHQPATALSRPTRADMLGGGEIVISRVTEALLEPVHV
jgi:hypothetical protein